VNSTSASGQVSPECIIDLIRQEFAERLTLFQIDGATHLIWDLGLDSMDIVRLQVVLEDFYGIRFDPETTDFDKVFATPETLAIHVCREVRRPR
jgi:acyl carrier protein